MAGNPKEPYGPASQAHYADPGYQDDGERRYPLDSEEHCKAAWSYINQVDNAAKYSPAELARIKRRIKAAGRRYGIQFADDGGAASQSRALPSLYVRAFPLEDIHIRSGGDGRTVEAYAAVFGIPAQVRDQDGEYEEELDPALFRKTLADMAPAGSRSQWRVGVFYNHGMTLHGTPSERASLPLGVPLDIKTDRRGLLTVTRYNRSSLADDVLDGIRDGSIPGYSFTGSFLRSTPGVPRGGFRRSRAGTLQRVRRLEATLREYGPTPLPVYADAAVVGVRAAILRQFLADGMTPDEAVALATNSTLHGEPPDRSTHPAAGPRGNAALGNSRAASEEPRADAHSARSAVAWANTRADIRSRIGVRNHGQEEEERGTARAAR